MISLLKLKFSAVEHYSGAFTIFLKYFHLPFVFQMWIKNPSQFHPTCVHLGLWWNRKWLSDPCRSSFYPGVHNQWGSTWILCRSFSQKKPHCFLSFTVEHHDITDRFCHQILALSCAKIYSWHWVSRITELFLFAYRVMIPNRLLILAQMSQHNFSVGNVNKTLFMGVIFFLYTYEQSFLDTAWL